MSDYGYGGYGGYSYGGYSYYSDYGYNYWDTDDWYYSGYLNYNPYSVYIGASLVRVIQSPMLYIVVAIYRLVSYPAPSFSLPQLAYTYHRFNANHMLLRRIASMNGTSICPEGRYLLPARLKRFA